MYVFLSVNLTNRENLSIKGIDKLAQVCYNENKLKNKIKKLTNKTKKETK